MVYGELGRYPIYIDIKIRTVCYWTRLIVGKQTKYSNILYRLCRQLNANHNMQFRIPNWRKYHYIFECIYFNQKRKQSLLNYFIYRHNFIKFSEIMSSKRKPILKKLSFYKCYQYRCLSSRLLILCNLSPNLYICCK
jgi:hypothetical protein